MSVIHENLEPGVINTDLLKKLIIEQGPQGEAGRLFLSDGIVLDEVKAIRLEYLNILKIDNLWMMTSLVKLHLGINIIEKIENLDALVNLIELDLSFNNIEVIENIDKLVNLEIFSIFQNNISKIENMEALTRLRLFNIGNNKIEDDENVIYLRQFPSLRSLNMAGNPCTKHASFTDYVFAFLPQLTYYEYRYIPPKSREEACEKYRKPLMELEEVEGKVKKEKSIEEEYQHRQEMYAEAFIENLDMDQFFLAMFEKDDEGNALLKMGDEAIELYNDYHDSFCLIINKLFDLGLEHQKIREEEIRQYKQCIDEIKDGNVKDIEKLMGDFFEKKAQIFMVMKTAIRGIETMDLDQKHHYEQIEKCTEGFSELCQSTWNKLMEGESVIADQLEESNSSFERNINDLVATFIEAAQTLFTECRNLQQGFNEQLSEIGNRYITNLNIKADAKIVVPKELQAIVVDRDSLAKAMTGTQDVHMQVIDGREDQLVTRIKNWASTMCDEIHRNEMTRNRSKIKEFNHFVDVQLHDFDVLHARLHDM